uniref:Uncharacterized protein n=1 Tax=Mustela putorius furo TaxID=9669 RepID=M3YTP2_MUSPF
MPFGQKHQETMMVVNGCAGQSSGLLIAMYSNPCGVTAYSHSTKVQHFKSQRMLRSSYSTESMTPRGTGSSQKQTRKPPDEKSIGHPPGRHFPQCQDHDCTPRWRFQSVTKKWVITAQAESISAVSFGIWVL